MALKFVRNSLPGATNPYKVTIEALEGAFDSAIDRGPLALPTNPESWRVRFSPQWRQRNSLGAQIDESDWTGNQPASVSWHQTIAVDPVRVQGNVVTVDEAALDSLETILLQLERWATVPDSQTGEPTRLFIQLGVHAFSAVIDSFEVNRVRTDPRGRALVAEVDLSFKVVPTN